MSRVPFLSLAALHADVMDELEEAMTRVVRSGWYVSGPQVEAFETEFASYCDVEGAVGVGNGVEALELTLRALGIGAGDEVLVSAYTAVATWLAITHAGSRPVPIEPDEETMQIDPCRAGAAITPRTAAIVAVHLYGMPADIEALTRFAERHGLALIEDASQAHGARVHGRQVGSFGVAGAFSLYPTKNLGAIGDAGIVVSDDHRLLERIRVLANYGERRRYESEVLGYNSRLDELQAGILRVKLRRLEGRNQSRRERAGQYLRLLGHSPYVVLPGTTESALPVWHQFVVRVPERDAVREELARGEVETLVHYPIAPHRAPAYAADYPEGLPITERLAESVLGLPISPVLAEDACEEVSRALIASVAAQRATPSV
jgi:dTDP-3-amino-3,4,6-trideoxy-alpha-D-glucose transaminase